MIEAHIH